MSEENIKRFNESVRSLYNTIMDKPLQVLGIFNDFFGEDKVDMQGVCSEDELRSWLKVTPISYYIHINDLSANSIIELPQNEFELALSSLFCETTIATIVNNKFKNIFILVHFPHVRVTNEHDRFVDINHLWAKIKIQINGTMDGSFTLNRSEYQAVHFMSNYLHSHIFTIPKSDFTKFQRPCTGSGPINSTMSSLSREFDSDLWQLFCLELSKFVTVESLKGGPYNYLEKIGVNNMDIGISSFTVFKVPGSPFTRNRGKLKKFVEYFVQGNHLKFNYVNGSYSIGMSFIEFIVLISNEFIKWYNEQFNDKKEVTSFEVLKKSCVVRECIISNGKIYYNNNRYNTDNLTSYIGKKVCTFKGKEITLNIVGISKVNNENKSIILKKEGLIFKVISFIKNILKIKHLLIQWLQRLY